MSDFITLSCPSCGHKLQITEDIDRFACAACGNEHIVNRSGGIVTLKPVIESIGKVQDGVDKTASELAIARLRVDINNLEDKINNIMSRKSILVDFTSGTIGLVGIIILFLIGLLIALQGGEATVFGLCIIIPAIILFIVRIKISGIERKKNYKDVKPFLEELEIKKRELSEHLKVVSKYK